jgi:hypothetical protein
VTLFCVKSRLWLLGIPTNWAWVVSLFLCNCVWSVCFVSSSTLYLILNNVLQMDTIRTSNKGYSVELFVVTFNHMKESVDNGSKVHVLLVSLQLQFLHSFPPNPCFAQKVAQQIYPISQEQIWVFHLNILHHFSSPLLSGCTTVTPIFKDKNRMHKRLMCVLGYDHTHK